MRQAEERTDCGYSRLYFTLPQPVLSPAKGFIADKMGCLSPAGFKSAIKVGIIGDKEGVAGDKLASVPDRRKGISWRKRKKSGENGLPAVWEIWEGPQKRC